MKRTIDELALFGGTPRFREPLHVGLPNIGDRTDLRRRIDAALDRRWLTNDGPLVRELESKLALYLGVDHCILTSNATAALEVLARALALSGEVIVPAFTFIATAHAFAWLGLKPVFCDVLPETHTIDVGAAGALVSARTAAVVGVHLWGGGCDTAGLAQLSDRFKVPLVLDAAHAFGSTIAGNPIGGFGSAEVFSFHATKFFSTFEGGAITTNDAALARELRLMRNFGFSGYDQIDSLGINAKMNEISAAMGLTSLEAVPALLELNHARFQQYHAALTGIAGVRLWQPPAGEQCNHQYVVTEISAGAGLTRDQLLALLWAENVRARRYFYPGCHRVPPYASSPAPPLPVTERLVNEVMVLPTGGAASESQVADVCELIRFALANAGALAGRIPAAVPAAELQA